MEKNEIQAFVFPEQNMWAPILPKAKRFHLCNRLIDNIKDKYIFRLTVGEDYGWSFDLFVDGVCIIKYNRSWNPDNKKEFTLASETSYIYFLKIIKIHNPALFSKNNVNEINEGIQSILIKYKDIDEEPAPYNKFASLLNFPLVGRYLYADMMKARKSEIIYDNAIYIGAPVNKSTG